MLENGNLAGVPTNMSRGWTLVATIPASGIVFLNSLAMVVNAIMAFTGGLVAAATIGDTSSHPR